MALIQAALDPEQMVASRRGLGGPQAEEVTRMLQAGHERADASRSWLRDTRARLAEAQSALDAAFARVTAAAR